MFTDLVIGGAGFLGSTLIKKLTSAGHQVRAIDLLNDDSVRASTDFRQFDLHDREQLRDALKGIKTVHYCAALNPLKKAGSGFFDFNVTGTKILLEEINRAKVKHLSYFSSSAIFGNVKAEDCPIGPNFTNYRPIEIYGRSRLLGEKVISDYIGKNPELSLSIIRPRTILGPGRLGIFQILFDWVAEGRNIYIIGDGKNLIQFSHVEDCADVSMETAQKRVSGIFNLGTDQISTLRSALETFFILAGAKSKIVSIPFPIAVSALYLCDKFGLSPLAPWHYLSYHRTLYFEMDNVYARLKWRAKMSNAEMLYQSYLWYLENKATVATSLEASSHRASLNQGILKIVKRFA